jgi:hypothetical protein
MTDSKKEKEVRFYLDRTKESAITAIRSITSDPRLTAEESMKLLFEISELHQKVVALIEENYAKASNANCTGESTKNWH